MGSSHSVEKKSPSKEESSPSKTNLKDSPKVKENPASQGSPSKVIADESKSTETVSQPDTVEEVSSKIEGLKITPSTPDGVKDNAARSDFTVTDEEVASVEAVSKTLLNAPGGKSLEIILSPAVKKAKSRISPPTSPSSNQETIAKRLQDAEERKQVIEQEKLQKLAAKLEKIPSAQVKKEKIIAEKSELIKEKLESKLSHAEENKKKHMDEVKDKISEHASKIEKAQQALEAAIEAAKEATKAGLDEKMSKNEEKKNEQLREMMNALTEHSERIKNVRNNMEEKMKPKAQQILDSMAKKEEASRELLAKQEAERKLKVEESKKKGELVRLNKEKLAAEANITTESA